MIQSLLSGRSGRTRVRVSVVRDWLARRLRRVGDAGTLKSSRRPIHDKERSVALLMQRGRCPATTTVPALPVGLWSASRDTLLMATRIGPSATAGASRSGERRGELGQPAEQFLTPSRIEHAPMVFPARGT